MTTATSASASAAAAASESFRRGDGCLQSSSSPRGCSSRSRRRIRSVVVVGIDIDNAAVVLLLLVVLLLGFTTPPGIEGVRSPSPSVVLLGEIKSDSKSKKKKKRNGVVGVNGLPTSFVGTSSSTTTTTDLSPRGGGAAVSRVERGIRARTAKSKAATTTTKKAASTTADTASSPPPPSPPSIYWAVLHNWLYFLSLGFNATNIPLMIRSIVDGDGDDPRGAAAKNKKPSPASITLSGNVEAVDKILTFGGVAVLAAISDRRGRKPLIVWSSLGFAVTNFLQAFAASRSGLSPGSARFLLYLADFVDGCTSCMTPVCQAYVADVSPGGTLATNLGIFQGLSIGGAFVVAFPVGGLLGAKYGPKVPIAAAGFVQLVNGLLALTVTPESNARVVVRARARRRRSAAAAKKKKTANDDDDDDPLPPIRYSEVNPVTGLRKLFGIRTTGGFGTTETGLLRTASVAYFLLSLSRGSLNAQFINYTNIRFGWTQAQSGPVLVVTGLMLAIVPRITVPLLGLRRSINFGLFVSGLGLSCAGSASSSGPFVASIFLTAVGMASSPALSALLAGLASPSEAGALLGALGSMGELCGAISSWMYAAILAAFAAPSSMHESSSSRLPGMHFLVGAGFSFAACAVTAARSRLDEKTTEAAKTKTTTTKTK